MTIAQPFMAGSSVNQMEKSREGRQNGSFVPDGTLGICEPRIPAMNGWAIFNGVRNGTLIPQGQRGAWLAPGSGGGTMGSLGAGHYFTGRGARCLAKTEIKLGRTPHSVHPP